MMIDLIPPNVEGKSTDLKFSLSFKTIDDARCRYLVAVERMLKPGIWQELAGAAGAAFKLLDPDGGEIDRAAAAGDFIRINIPGPGPSQGDGYDWTRVAKIECQVNAGDGREWSGMKVHPSSNPNSIASQAAHFFQPSASSTFIIKREGTTVTALYYGRNEKPNTRTPRFMDNVRNRLVAAGAALGLSEIQWSALIKGFLVREDAQKGAV